MLLLGPLLAFGWSKWQVFQAWKARREAELQLQRERAEAQAAFAAVQMQLNQLRIGGGMTKVKSISTGDESMYGGAALQPADDENRSDESFPESDPR
jgi:hypothetical protein